ncbi:PepSY domain-containing protein [Ciceribacter thiooxidans]|uniref:PepSY domain-containing protein n=1 Tax=Ciceribacter thiooxidans TaxID=1969821 RepID=A0ABV7I8N8_9HYPH|nr:PepSY domain-containing protein [Ciceribacter thiooxidans]
MSMRLGDWLSRLSLAGLVAAALLAMPVRVYADDDGHDDGHESSDSDSGDGGHDDGGNDRGGDSGGGSSGRGGGSSSSSDHDDSRDRIQKAVALGKMKSLATLQKILRQRVSGDIVSVELLRVGRRPVYEFRVLKPNGRVVEINIDAETGTVLQIENN